MLSGTPGCGHQALVSLGSWAWGPTKQRGAHDPSSLLLTFYTRQLQLLLGSRSPLSTLFALLYIEKFPITTRVNNRMLYNGRVQSIRVQLFSTPWTVACKASLSITNSRRLHKLRSIESVMSSSHLILYRPLLLPPILPSIRVVSSESALLIRWPKYWSFSFNISPSKEYSGLMSFRID